MRGRDLQTEGFFNSENIFQVDSFQKEKKKLWNNTRLCEES